MDGIKVTVFESSRQVKPEEVPGLKEQVHAVVDERVAQLSSGKVAEPLSRTTVNGTPGFTLRTATCTKAARSHAVSSFLFSGAVSVRGAPGEAATQDWAGLPARPHGLEAADAGSRDCTPWRLDRLLDPQRRGREQRVEA